MAWGGGDYPDKKYWHWTLISLVPKVYFQIMQQNTLELILPEKLTWHYTRPGDSNFSLFKQKPSYQIHAVKSLLTVQDSSQTQTPLFIPVSNRLNNYIPNAKHTLIQHQLFKEGVKILNLRFILKMLFEQLCS